MSRRSIVPLPKFDRRPSVILPSDSRGGLLRYFDSFGGQVRGVRGPVVSPRNGGIIINQPVGTIPEEVGLGDVDSRWPGVTVIGSPEEYIEPDNSRVVMVFKVPWLLRGSFMAELLGWPYLDDTGYKRHLPEWYQNWTFALGDDPVPDTPVMWCTKAVAKGVGIREDWITQNPDKDFQYANYYPDPYFEWAYVTATFETLKYNVDLLDNIIGTPNQPAEMQRYTFKTEDAAGRYLQFGTGQWSLRYDNGDGTFKGPNPAGNTAVNFWENYQLVTYTWYDVLDGMTNHNRNQTLCGFTNLYQLDNYAAGTLILQKATRIPRKTPFGTRVYEHTFEFIYKPYGVNKALPPGLRAQDLQDPLTGSPAYWDILLNSDAKAGLPTDQCRKPYQATDLSVIWLP